MGSCNVSLISENARSFEGSESRPKSDRSRLCESIDWDEDAAASLPTGRRDLIPQHRALKCSTCASAPMELRVGSSHPSTSRMRNDGNRICRNPAISRSGLFLRLRATRLRLAGAIVAPSPSEGEDSDRLSDFISSNEAMELLKPPKTWCSLTDAFETTDEIELSSRISARSAVVRATSACEDIRAAVWAGALVECKCIGAILADIQPRIRMRFKQCNGCGIEARSFSPCRKSSSWMQPAPASLNMLCQLEGRHFPGNFQTNLTP